MEQKINLDRLEQAEALFGSFDENVRLIEKEFGVALVAVSYTHLMKKFVCTVCGYVYEGEAAPEKCPVCGAPAEKFVERCV